MQLSVKQNSKLKNIISALLIGIAASIFALAISEFQLFKTWESQTYDMRMKLTRGGRVKPGHVVMFYVDEPSLRYMDAQGVGWPWPRELYSSALDFCRRGGAKAVIFDLFYSEDSVYGVDDDLAFAQGVKDGPPSYFVSFLSANEALPDPRAEAVIKKSGVPFDGAFPSWVPAGRSLISLPIEPLLEAALGFGNAQIPPDPDGVYRRVDLLGRLNDAAIPSIPLKVVSDLKGVKKISWPRENQFLIDNTSVPLDDGGRIMVNYYGGTDTFTAYSLAQVISSDSELKAGKQPGIAPEAVKDKVVIIGLAAPGLYDMKSSPFSLTYPGPEVHATVIENLLTGDFLRPMHRVPSMAIVIVCGIMASLGLAWIASSWGIGLWLIILISSLVGSSFLLFYRGIWMPLVAPFGSLALSSFAMILFKFLTEGRKKREIRRAFRQYLSPDIVNKIADDPASLKLGGEQKEITVFFSDIADFTTISEATPPDELVERLNEYFSTTTRIIQAQGGTLDKYIGDAIMAFWGAPLATPDQAARAVLSALEIQKALTTGSKFITRIGIHTDRAVVGNIGSDIRFNYTAIGDGVNLASRLEGLNKKFGTKIIISERTYAGAKESIEARRIGSVRVKGKMNAIGIFEPLGPKGDHGKFSAKDLSAFEEGLKLFETSRFKEAEAIFEGLALNRADTASKSYWNLSKEYALNPPEGFEGVMTFTTK